MVKDEWIRAAMTDDRVVVELLLRLKQAHAAAPARPQAVIPIRWGYDFRGPSQLQRHPCDVTSFVRGKKEILLLDVVQPRRFHGAVVAALPPPQPPLTASKRPALMSPALLLAPDPSRKSRRDPTTSLAVGTATAETASTSTKRSRRKKTFAELKEEESFLLKERMHLKKEITTLNSTFEEQVARNENLKRIKFDLKLQYANNSSLASDVLEKEICNRPYKENPLLPTTSVQCCLNMFNVMMISSWIPVKHKRQFQTMTDPSCYLI
ncbi:hypothetical protein GH714_023328 [Hevea brasiliensis]|uniref:BZIP domain-containing protein n=1 Tax=Hevea brasiliensis TaxID=3981 RepID=A0A6A6LQP3_HEVBR|nr:hypothetical protein GH714_023328 [Hevea brasiliensis]